MFTLNELIDSCASGTYVRAKCHTPEPKEYAFEIRVRNRHKIKKEIRERFGGVPLVLTIYLLPKANELYVECLHMIE